MKRIEIYKLTFVSYVYFNFIFYCHYCVKCQADRTQTGHTGIFLLYLSFNRLYKSNTDVVQVSFSQAD